MCCMDLTKAAGTAIIILTDVFRHRFAIVSVPELADARDLGCVTIVCCFSVCVDR